MILVGGKEGGFTSQFHTKALSEGSLQSLIYAEDSWYTHTDLSNLREVRRSGDITPYLTFQEITFL